jgi:hypothetical protein
VPTSIRLAECMARRERTDGLDDESSEMMLPMLDGENGDVVDGDVSFTGEGSADATRGAMMATMIFSMQRLTLFGAVKNVLGY